MAERESVHVALSRVMADVQAVGKADRNKDQNFSYRGIDTVINAVGPAFRDHKIVALPYETTLVHDERYETKRGANMRGVTVRVVWRFYGPAGDYLQACTLGEAADAGDKAVAKASSVAYRIALLQTLCIPTDDEDPDATSHERAKPERRMEGPPPFPIPKSWAEIEKVVRKCDNTEEAWALFQAFTRAASVHLFGKAESSELEQAEKDTLYQKAAGAAVWLVEHQTYEMGELYFYDETKQRQAWQHVLATTDPLPIPDYVAPEAGELEMDEAAREAAEAEAEMDAEANAQAKSDAETGYS